eukprot:TRINITY_DN67753_c0_g1_i1.p3 TRINITY_DN67753_c0_g1~~TRINITY_DN67753_c0_g1_i1.p3  ORF type:complete len:103 (+),score=29.37 TRINITY_DN67753_c0_g1_i1:73-381(+)
MGFFFFSSRRRHTRCREVSWARRCVQETGRQQDFIFVIPPIIKIRLAHKRRLGQFSLGQAPATGHVSGSRQVYISSVPAAKTEESCANSSLSIAFSFLALNK